MDILDVGPFQQEDSGPYPGQGWGYTGVFATQNGGGFLTEQFPDAYKVIWDFQGGQATSRHIPGVSYTGIVHPGLMGTAPSAALLAKWNGRETALIATDPNRVPPLALPPLADSAILGSLTGAEFDRVAAEAARTAPPRENGGNQDIKNFTKGTRVFYPVFVDGAKLSMGDLHFSQGDGEITFCGAIEMGGFIDLGVDLIKGGMSTYGVSENAIFMPGNVDPHYDEWLAFSGTSVTLDGRAAVPRLASGVPARVPACHRLPAEVRLQRQQAYMILGSAPIEGRLSGVVDIPNSCSTVYIPDRDFRHRRPRLRGRTATGRTGHGRAEGQFLTRCGRGRRQPVFGGLRPWRAPSAAPAHRTRTSDIASPVPRFQIVWSARLRRRHDVGRARRSEPAGSDISTARCLPCRNGWSTSRWWGSSSTACAAWGRSCS